MIAVREDGVGVAARERGRDTVVGGSGLRELIRAERRVSGVTPRGGGDGRGGNGPGQATGNKIMSKCRYEGSK